MPDSNESLPSSGVYTHTREEIARMGWIVIILHYYSVPTQQDHHSRYPRGLQSEPEMVDLINKVAAKIPSLWDQVGIQLRVPYEDLSGCQDSNPSAPCSRKFTYVFASWRSRRTSEYTWAKLITALRSPAVFQNRLADELTVKLRGPQYPQ